VWLGNADGFGRADVRRDATIGEIESRLSSELRTRRRQHQGLMRQHGHHGQGQLGHQGHPGDGPVGGGAAAATAGGAAAATAASGAAAAAELEHTHERPKASGAPAAAADDGQLPGGRTPCVELRDGTANGERLPPLSSAEETGLFSKRGHLQAVLVPCAAGDEGLDEPSLAGGVHADNGAGVHGEGAAGDHHPQPQPKPQSRAAAAAVEEPPLLLAAPQ